jgi:hypothetical protein
MKKLFALAIAVSLGGCANLKNEWANITTATVPTSGVIVAGNSFDAVESVAASYLTFCKQNRSVPVCSKYVQIRRELLPAIRAARVARTNLETFLQTHPGQLGPSGLYDSLQASINTVQAIITKYSVTPNGAAS